MSRDSWILAVEMVASYKKQPARLTHLLERLPEGIDPGVRRRCQSLLWGTVRHLSLLEKALDEFLRKRPKPMLWASLLVSSRELMERPERAAKVVHHAVERIGKQFSKAERGLANAVLRKVSGRLAELQAMEVDGVEDLAWRYSHPQWRVKHWLEQFGLEETKRFLAWNQEEGQSYARWQRDQRMADFLEETQWEGFFRVKSEGWPEALAALAAGELYAQNPGARVAPGLLVEEFGGGRVLDLCAAPGGKSLLLEQQLGERVEEIVAVDLEGPRFERMEGNFLRYATKRIRAVQGDMESLDTLGLGLFDAVLLDVPCSNSGVLQHKVDARWRMTEAEFGELLDLQRRFLQAAARQVSLGGVLVYSTCSVDKEENEAMVDAFLKSEDGQGYRLESSVVSYPWVQRHDGSGAFLLRRQ